MRKKILTLFLAFAIMMTFMPSMAFAAENEIDNIEVNLTITSDGDVSINTNSSNAKVDLFQMAFGIDASQDPFLYYQYLEGVEEWAGEESETGLAELLKTESWLQLQLSVQALGDYIFADDIDISLNVNNKNLPVYLTIPEDPNAEEGMASIENEGKTLYMLGQVNWPIPLNDKSDLIKKLVKGAAIVAGAAAVVGVVGTVVKNVQKAVVANQMAFQAKMQQKMVQKQVASIKTVLKGAGVVFSLANFGSSLGKLFQLNQFGFNPFVFR